MWHPHYVKVSLFKTKELNFASGEACSHWYDIEKISTTFEFMCRIKQYFISVQYQYIYLEQMCVILVVT